MALCAEEEIWGEACQDTHAEERQCSWGHHLLGELLHHSLAVVSYRGHFMTKGWSMTRKVSLHLSLFHD